jgi:glutamyl-tRNA synthetase
MTAKGIRYAPSPTGTLHLGNLRTAWISALWAKKLGEPWIVRFEDIDLPRVVDGAQEKQLHDLRALGLVPDQVLTQSSFLERHESLMVEGIRMGRIYPCFCSRKEVQTALLAAASAPHDRPVAYAGACRQRTEFPLLTKSSIAWRFRSEDPSGAEDFIVARSAPVRSLEDPLADFVPAYHWACAIDDNDGDYRLLVRAQDLADAHPIQSKIREWLADFEKRPPRHRLEKRTAGVTLDELMAAGVQPAQIVERFEKTFDHALLERKFAAGESFGEKAPTRRLQEIGF